MEEARLRKLKRCMRWAARRPRPKLVPPKKPLFKRCGNRDYRRHASQLEYIFRQEFPLFTSQTVKKLVAQTGIPCQRLYSWYGHWMRDPDWRPWDPANHGSHSRIFTDEEESGLSLFIVDNYIIPHRLFCNETFRDLAIQTFLQKWRDATGSIPSFNCSDGFICDFKNRNGFSSRAAHAKRRPYVNPEEQDRWLKRIRELLRVTPLTRIVNVDETAWRIYPTGLRTWALTGAQTIQIHTDFDEKTCFTAIAAITAARTKLPLAMIAKGKTDVVERNWFADISPHIPLHSESGWTTDETFRTYLGWLRQVFDDGEPFWVLCDNYPVHNQRDLVTWAKEIGINLEFIPPGMTDAFQPLDRAVFGVMKSVCRRLFRKHVEEDASCQLNTQLAARFLIRAWELISPHLLEEAWNIYIDADERNSDQ